MERQHAIATSSTADKPPHLLQDLCSRCNDWGYTIERGRWGRPVEIDCEECPHCHCSGRCANHNTRAFNECWAELELHGEDLLPDSGDVAHLRLPTKDGWVLVAEWRAGR